MSSTSLALATGAAGLAGGLALGITGFASAADPSPGPRPDASVQLRGDGRHPTGPGFGHGFGRKSHLRGAGGLVRSVGADSLTVLTHDGTKTVALNGDTRYYEGRTEATRSAVEAGLVVHLRLVDPRAERAVAAVVRVVPARVAGWVVDVDGSTVTVTDLSGFTRTIRTDGGTTYVKDGATATRSVVAEGVLVHAVGQVADDGTTLEADRVGVGRPGLRDREPRDEPNA